MSKSHEKLSSIHQYLLPTSSTAYNRMHDTETFSEQNCREKRSSKKKRLNFDDESSNTTITPQSPSQLSPVNSTDDNEQIIIIGAGVAGLRCAEILAEKFPQSRILLIEARDRTGGRTWTINVGDVPIDIGGTWIEGWKHNPMFKLAKKHGFRTAKFKRDTIPLCFDFDGSSVPFDVYKNVRDVSDQVKREIFSSPYQKALVTDISIAEAVDQSTTKNGYVFPETSIHKRIFVHEMQDLENHNGGSLSDLSLKHHFEGPDFDGDDEFVRDGYGALVQKIADRVLSFPNVTLLLQTPVSRIEHDDQECRIHTTKGEVYHGSKVICTIPLGVLKSRKIKFEPDLPTEKWEAIDRVGFGLLNKIVLRFEKPFWPKHMHSLNYYSDISGEYRLFLNIGAYETIPDDCGVLVCYVVSDAARRLESLSDKEVELKIMDVLKKCFKDDNLPNPVEFLITRWEKDEYALGAFTFMKKKSRLMDFKILSEPINRLRFAGEHTSPYYSTVHSAYISGEREAFNLIRQASKGKKKHSQLIEKSKSFEDVDDLSNFTSEPVPPQTE